ncbi:transcriptional regulator [Mycetohabitans rhizoxinica]|uniref:Transcriptional regulator n=1 Tax=Mycetohabitans rhizoxinica TaxID=412963 RepID=A0ABZ2PY29_9BURK
MPKTEKELIARDATRGIGAELLQAVKQMKAGKAARTTKVEVSVASKARRVVGLSQTQFATTVLGVSVRTLQEWEQGHCKPTGAAQRLLSITTRHPKVLIEELSVS